MRRHGPPFKLEWLNGSLGLCSPKRLSSAGQLTRCRQPPDHLVMARQELFVPIQLTRQILVSVLVLQAAVGDELLQLGQRSVMWLPSLTHRVEIDSDYEILRHACRLQSECHDCTSRRPEGHQQCTRCTFT